MGRLIGYRGPFSGRKSLEPVSDFGLDFGEFLKGFVERSSAGSLKLANAPVGFLVGVVEQRVNARIGLCAGEMHFRTLAAMEIPMAAEDFPEEVSFDARGWFQEIAKGGFHIEVDLFLAGGNEKAEIGGCLQRRVVVRRV